MRYDNPELIDQLAGAYVLGTLQGAARRRFERMAGQRMGIRQAIWVWERRLNLLAEGQSAVEPAPEVWDNLERRVFAETRPAARGAGLWKFVSAALAAAVLLLAIPLAQPPETAESADRLALIQSDTQEPLWVITVDTQTGTLKSRAVNEPARQADRVFELWMLAADGQPRSFGLLPVADDGRVSSPLSPALLALLGNAQGLAVSIEPLGGSPTGAPTGPVVYSAPIIEL